MSETPRTLSKQEQEELGMKRDYTQERKDRVIPAVSALYQAMAGYNFRPVVRQKDDTDKKRTEESDAYREFVANQVREIILKNRFRYDDIQYFISLTVTASNLLEEVTQEVDYNDRVLAAADEIIELVAKEENITPTEREFVKTEEISKVEEKLIKINTDIQDLIQNETKMDGVEFMQKKADLEKRQQQLLNHAEDLIYKQSKGYVVFRDIMRRVIEPTFEKHNIKFYEASSVFAVISNRVDNVTKTLSAVMKGIRDKAEETVWGVEDIKNDLTVEKVLETLENKE